MTSVPTPNIMTASLAACLCHEAFHVADGDRQAIKHRTRNDGVADVEFDDLFDDRDFCNVLIVQSMSGIDNKAQVMSVFGCCNNTLQFGFLFIVARIRVTSRMQLHDGRADYHGRI